MIVSQTNERANREGVRPVFHRTNFGNCTSHRPTGRATARTNGRSSLLLAMRLRSGEPSGPVSRRRLVARAVRPTSGFGAPRYLLVLRVLGQRVGIALQDPNDEFGARVRSRFPENALHVIADGSVADEQAVRDARAAEAF